ncbi:MAG: thioredoxin family protein [Actinobacteria bacterium]|nr:thioredoxin family protein [Actinomycetota bacterium]|tara:strand:- start:122 stop:703 length:582 start_codon:yes stop_codon:yes gene_type:complete
MVEKQSTMLALGTKTPDFSLKGIDGEVYSNASFEESKGLLVMFICNHCPFVVHVKDGLVEMANRLSEQNIAVIAINSNDSSQEKYAEDSFEKMIEYSNDWGFQFPYTVDVDQSVAKAFTAQCTPDFFLFDSNSELVYRGQMDGSRPGNDVPTTGVDILNAVDAMLAGDSPLDSQFPSAGCNIKWIPGEEPDYF